MRRRTALVAARWSGTSAASRARASRNRTTRAARSVRATEANTSAVTGAGGCLWSATPSSSSVAPRARAPGWTRSADAEQACDVGRRPYPEVVDGVGRGAVEEERARDHGDHEDGWPRDRADGAQRPQGHQRRGGRQEQLPAPSTPSWLLCSARMARSSSTTTSTTALVRGHATSGRGVGEAGEEDHISALVP